MPVIMGTAGHIDHGKTRLIQALTGIDCDRLKEEKKRGITIELGFAFMDLDGGQRLGIVDVPGHERFVKNMVAGAAGIDFVLLVVAADEGVMPQTREHLEICSILGIERGLVALTKIDLVDSELRQLVEEDIHSCLEGTSLAGAPVFPVSARTRVGVDSLNQAIGRIAGETETRQEFDLFRLPVDRVFSLRGHGTVVTGTLVSGTVNLGEEITIYPQGLGCRVRDLQVHGQGVQSSQAGQRTACNLAGIGHEDISRGQVLARPETLFPSRVWDLELTCLASAPRALRQRTELHFHHGAKEVLARVFFLDRDRLQPGQSALAQVRFSEPMVGVFGDRFVLRAYSPLRTVAGGRVLSPLSERVGRRSRQVEQLAGLARGGKREILLGQLARAGQSGLDLPRLRVLTGMSLEGLPEYLQGPELAQEVQSIDPNRGPYLHIQVLRGLEKGLLDFVAGYHEQHPMRPGVPRSELGSGWGNGLAPKLLDYLLGQALSQGLLAQSGRVYHLPGHQVAWSAEQRRQRDLILRRYQQAGRRPPNLSQVLGELGLTRGQTAPLLDSLLESKELVKVKEELYFPALVIEELRGQVRGYLQENSTLSPVDFKGLTGLSRKYAIALLEFFDRERLTLRVGDSRRLRQG